VIRPSGNACIAMARRRALRVGGFFAKSATAVTFATRHA